VSHIGERLSLYTQLDEIEDEQKLAVFLQQLQDRFGPIPEQVQELAKALRARKIAKQLGFEKLILKNETLRLYFLNNPDSAYFESAQFQFIMQYVQVQLANAKLKQVGTNFILIINQVKTMNDVLWYLQGMEMKEITS
jgi:transcription-repair coupling factor (superfamily II helicase)